MTIETRVMDIFEGVQIVIWDSSEETGDPEYPTYDATYCVVYFPNDAAKTRAELVGLMPDSHFVDVRGNPVWMFDDGGHPQGLRGWLRSELAPLLDNGARWIESDYAPDRTYHSAAPCVGLVEGELLHLGDDGDVIVVVLPSDALPLAQLVASLEYGAVFATPYATILSLECDAHDARVLCARWGIHIANE